MRETEGNTYHFGVRGKVFPTGRRNSALRKLLRALRARNSEFSMSNFRTVKNSETVLVVLYSYPTTVPVSYRHTRALRNCDIKKLRLKSKVLN